MQRIELINTDLYFSYKVIMKNFSFKIRFLQRPGPRNTLNKLKICQMFSLKKTVIASGGNESFPVQFALLERSNPLTFQEIASAKLVLSLSKETPRNDSKFLNK